eukprot:TRINITY_DN3353_c0_g1_i4.p1 TRINITY_DN3353_c0_g1~~TRINITY_DN3353_c0_g1_i4.p1  ORF type:complete len:301 (-),score=62.45 TRINITY_DN3353_c0_g1_i4:80-982(-)
MCIRDRPGSPGGNKNVNELSKKLLEGWVLISDSCPNAACSVPLVKSKSGEIYCIGCEKLYNLQSPGGLASPDPEQSFELSPIGAPSPVQHYGNSVPFSSSMFAPPPVPESPVRASPVSALSPSPQPTPPATHYNNSAEIAQKLLQGWVLLNDYCSEPGCNLPLVKNQEGMLQCVACKRITHPTEQAAVPELPALSPSPEFNKQMSVHSPSPSPQKDFIPSYNSAPISAQKESSNLQLANTQSSDSSMPWRQIADPTEKLLVQKIAAARRQLQDCHNVADSTALCSLIAEAANALKALQSL